MDGFLLILLFWQVTSLDLSQAREAVEAREYGEAVRLLDSVIRSDAGHAEAHYLRGVSLRERGRNPTLQTRLQRLLARSAEDFELVIAQDSAYQDVLLQYAILKRYQNDLQQAILLGEMQMRYRPDLQHVLPHLLSFYWRYVVTREPDEARAWLRTQPGYLARLFVGRTYERQGMYGMAERIYRESEGAGKTVPLLARARLEFARMQREEGTRAIQQAITRLNSKADALVLFEEIKTIVRPAELAAFAKIEEIQRYREFFRIFWSSRDPMPAAPYNARMAEHYRRLRIAEQEYLLHGFRSWFRSAFTYQEGNFPPAYALSSDFTDRGVVFLRHGEPDDYTVGEANSWHYQNSLLVFHFAPTCIAQICSVTDHFVPVPEGPTFPPSIVGLDPLDAERISIEFIAKGLSTDRHQWSSDVRHWDIPHVTGAFRGIDGRTLLEVYYEIPLHETAHVSGPDSVLVETGFAVHTTDWVRTNHIREQKRHLRGSPALVDRFQIDLPARRFNLALHARVLDGVHVQSIRFEYAVPEFTSTGLQLSDILLADSVDALPDAKLRDEVILYVNPSGKFQRNAAPVVYFEIYNLEREPDGRTRYRIAYSLTPKYRGEPGAVTLQTSEQRGAQGMEISYVSLDLGEAVPGEYLLEAEVEDLATGRTAVAERLLSVK